MQDGYVERFDQKISPRPSFPKRGITISPFGKGGIRGILRIVGVVLSAPAGIAPIFYSECKNFQGENFEIARRESARGKGIEQKA
jgi:hypothetical protein